MNCQLILKIIIIIVFIPSCSFAWFNRGTRCYLITMQNLFSKRDLITLYNEYVHPDIKSDVLTLIDAMKMKKLMIERLLYVLALLIITNIIAPRIR
jgi:hypothetical protein